jgi:putative mycofactocin binding protein MftB
MSVDLAPRVDLDGVWGLAPGVALRPEPFGALAYHFGTRRLTFLKTPELAAVVGSLAEHADVRDALLAAGVEPSRWNAYVKALVALADAGMIAPRAEERR